MDCTVFTYILKYNLIPYGLGTIVGVSTTRCIVCYPPCSIKAGSHEYTCPEAYAGVGGLAENSILISQTADATKNCLACKFIYTLCAIHSNKPRHTRSSNNGDRGWWNRACTSYIMWPRREYCELVESSCHWRVSSLEASYQWAGQCHCLLWCKDYVSIGCSMLYNSWKCCWR